MYQKLWIDSALEYRITEDIKNIFFKKLSNLLEYLIGFYIIV